MIASLRWRIRLRAGHRRIDLDQHLARSRQLEARDASEEGRENYEIEHMRDSAKRVAECA
jgi:hypothetical protein